jgi:hypothetical protein
MMKNKFTQIRKGVVILLTLSLLLTNFGMCFAGDGTKATVALREKQKAILLTNEQGLSEEVYNGLFKVITSDNFSSDYVLSSGYDVGQYIKDEQTIKDLGVLASEQYTDVPANEWYVNDIGLASALGIVNGDPDGTFRPDDSVTRAEFMAMLQRAVEGPETFVNAQKQYAGMLGTSYYANNEDMQGQWYSDIYVGFGQYIIPDGYYSVEEMDSPISRYEVIKWVVSKGLEETYGGDGTDFDVIINAITENSDTSSIKFFSDVPSYSEIELTSSVLEVMAGLHLDISEEEKEFGEYYVNPDLVEKGLDEVPEYYLTATVLCEKMGIVSGYPDGTFNGNGEITRAEACAIINRLAVEIVRQDKSELSINAYMYYKTGLEKYNTEGVQAELIAQGLEVEQEVEVEVTESEGGNLVAAGENSQGLNVGDIVQLGTTGRRDEYVTVAYEKDGVYYTEEGYEINISRAYINVVESLTEEAFVEEYFIVDKNNDLQYNLSAANVYISLDRQLEILAKHLLAEGCSQETVDSVITSIDEAKRDTYLGRVSGKYYEDGFHVWVSSGYAQNILVYIAYDK